ncbi:hypothetical protein [Pseudogemmobacter bohemicus]|uniref:hypothetical protein n=1 Tax=Pseudogemmobacter bohemicus TaxID=2250708 RepID=UPI0013009A5D|nr:hypothetical protein [Pseudogemmobacter bohemicus]
MRFPRLLALATAASLTLGFALPVKADLVIQGRAAQALHCAALLFIASEELYQAGYISRADYNGAQSASVRMLDYVPGTKNQKIQAMGQRFEKLLSRKSLPALMQEFDETAPWCGKTFL